MGTAPKGKTMNKQYVIDKIESVFQLEYDSDLEEDPEDPVLPKYTQGFDCHEMFFVDGNGDMQLGLRYVPDHLVQMEFRYRGHRSFRTVEDFIFEDMDPDDLFCTLFDPVFELIEEEITSGLGLLKAEAEAKRSGRPNLTLIDGGLCHDE